MTIGQLVEPEKALIWRGPKAHGAFTQLATQMRDLSGERCTFLRRLSVAPHGPTPGAQP